MCLVLMAPCALAISVARGSMAAALTLALLLPRPLQTVKNPRSVIIALWLLEPLTPTVLLPAALQPTIIRQVLGTGLHAVIRHLGITRLTKLLLTDKITRVHNTRRLSQAPTRAQNVGSSAIRSNVARMVPLEDLAVAGRASMTASMVVVQITMRIMAHRLNTLRAHAAQGRDLLVKSIPILGTNAVEALFARSPVAKRAAAPEAINTDSGPDV